MAVAFIPVRGGSKSIPLKNIKEIAGKPLLHWSLAALEAVPEVTKIVVATDSDKIESVALDFISSKVEIYRRNAENASDTASTESVMLEYLEHSDLDNHELFILVQATSPLTKSENIKEALDHLHATQSDSLLTGVRSFRFFWNDDGTPHNYDYRNRPRRQDFAGMFMENGAFYINTVASIKKDKNRLSGKIAMYEMPEYTAAEIDEPDDWVIVERLITRHSDA